MSGQTYLAKTSFAENLEKLEVIDSILAELGNSGGRWGDPP